MRVDGASVVAVSVVGALVLLRREPDSVLADQAIRKASPERTRFWKENVVPVVVAE